MNADPGLDLNCPKCQFKLRYMGSLRRGGDTKLSHIYWCSRHGGWLLTPKGFIVAYPSNQN